jgi:large subunit ribosomal protein L40
MAVFCRPCAEAARLQPLLRRNPFPVPLLVPFRGKKAAKKQRTRKDQKAVEIKEFAKRMEMQQVLYAATLKASKKGEPYDPEMLNPVRKRPLPTLSKEEKDRRFLLAKEWSRWRMQQHTDQLKLLQGMMRSRDKALRELKNISPTLYLRAFELNSGLFPLHCQGPTATPPKQSYMPPDPEDG